MPVVVESRKNNPLEPLSIKLFDNDWLLKTVVMFPMESTIRTEAPPNPLLDCVPMPKTSDPLVFTAPELEIAGNSRITPLLSVAKADTGWTTC